VRLDKHNIATCYVVFHSLRRFGAFVATEAESLSLFRLLRRRLLMKCSAMRGLTRTGFLASVALLLLLPGRTMAQDKPLTEKGLDGVWRGVRWDQGKGEDPSKGVQLELVFKENKVKGNRLPSGAIGEGTFKLSADGKSIDALGSTGGYKGKAYLGIIKVEGDTLYWCTATGGKNQKRPAGFEADPGEHSYLIIAKRER
jgi:uncharacterized protein (TIGR03067 family)